MTEETAKIIDTKKMIEQHENIDRVDKIVRTKKLNKQADEEFAHDFADKMKNPFLNMKMPKGGFKTKKPRKGKKPVIDFSRFTVNEYTYEEFSKAVNTVLPNVINHASFKDSKFLDKLKKSKDIKHFSNEQIMFPITNDYLGFASAVIGCAVEYYVENKMGYVQPTTQADATTEQNKRTFHKNECDLKFSEIDDNL